MKFIYTTTPDLGIQDLTHKLQQYLQSGQSVVWLVSGGSNIPISVEVLKALKIKVKPTLLKSLKVMLTDERYGPVGHLDSNWQQLFLVFCIQQKMQHSC